ncbi:membrane protein DedA with SNARE-associated domain [Acinetobacter baylyi]|nr:membrane protein DedA with SNARE-associated domain [Acinetobacter baylyi]
MNYTVFSIYNVIGAFIWIALLVTAGYLLGHTVMMIGNIQ